jgi:2-polyprenyl-6-hydroxyphenyl methylase/3-demethylubiquinone-9 3-methyltransferase
MHSSAYPRLKQAALKHSTNDPSADAFFADQAEDWERRYESRIYQQRRELVLGFVKAELDGIGRRPETIDVLDFGCGSGVLLTDLVQLGVKAAGVDSSSAMIEQACSRLAQVHGHVKLEWLSNGSSRGAYQKQNYDIVLCTSVLEFIPEIEVVVLNLCSLVRPGGILLVSVPNRRSWLRVVEKFVHRHRRFFRGLRRFDHLTGTDSYLSFQQHQLTLRELRSMVERHGLQPEQHRFHVAPRFLAKLENWGKFGMMLMATFRK